MQKVNVYIEQQYSGNFGAGVGKFSIVLELETNKGIVTREHYRGYKGTTKNRLALLACIEALKHITKTCEIKFFIDSPYVVGSIDVLEEWIRKGDKKKNWDLWTKYHELASKHMISFENMRENAYTPAMKIQLGIQEMIMVQDYRPENEV